MEKVQKKCKSHVDYKLIDQPEPPLIFVAREIAHRNGSIAETRRSNWPFSERVSTLVCHDQKTILNKQYRSWASRSHLGYLSQTPHYKITALQNSSKASADAAAKEYSLDNVATYDNPAAIASDPNVDIIAVSVNVPEHYGLIRPALEAGKDVFSEWPLARNGAEAEELVQLARKKGVRTLIGLQARQNPSIVKAKEIVASGALGKILGSTMYGHVS